MLPEKTEWQKRDLRSIWHPCSQMKDYETLPPIVIEWGKGIYLYDQTGKRYLDAISSWWVNLFGHANPKISKAIKEQLNKLEHVIFANFSHTPAILLSEKLLELAPIGLKKVFFADNGSSAVEAALKMAFQYQQQTGNSKKTRFIKLSDAYHGETLGALSVSDIDLYSKMYQPILFETLRADGPDCYRCPFGLKRETCGAECFNSMESLFNQYANETAAVIIEPLLQCAAGMKMYPPVYLKKLRALCDKHHVLLIADEIATGFGRTGTMFALSQAGISADLLCLSKGITGGFMPLSVVLTTDAIYNAFYSDYQEGKAFLHSHSYTGNTLACAAAVASLNLFDEDDVLTSNKVKSAYLHQKAFKAFHDLPHIGEYRSIGMVGAVELVKDTVLKTPFDSNLRMGYRVYQKALERGLLLRPLGNVLYFMPPYCITEREIDSMVETASDCIQEVFSEI